MEQKKDRCAHLIAIPFTGVGLRGGYRGDAWFAHRIDIFTQYTLRSLANQSNKDFLLWLWFRPEERSHPYIERIRQAIESVGLKYIITFDGLLYWDDKYSHYTLRTMAYNLMRMVWDVWYYKEWVNPFTILKYTWENKNKTLFERVSRSLDSVREVIGADYEWIYLTRLDSDDMLHSEAVNLIQDATPGWKKSLVFTQGYILNVQTGQVAEWNPPTNPPFHTVTFPGYVFLNPHEYIAYYGDFKTHEDATRVWTPEILDMHKYMVSFHGKHISTGWESPALKRAYHAIKYKPYCYTTSGRNISTQWESRTNRVRNFMIGKEFFDEEKQAILKDFGL